MSKDIIMFLDFLNAGLKKIVNNDKNKEIFMNALIQISKNNQEKMEQEQKQIFNFFESKFNELQILFKNLRNAFFSDDEKKLKKTFNIFICRFYEFKNFIKKLENIFLKEIFKENKKND